MKIMTNDKNMIIGYEQIGNSDLSEYHGSIPENFEVSFKPGYYLLQDNEIVVNPNYEDPTIDIPTPRPSGPSPEMLAINALGIQLAKHLAGGD